MKNFGKNVNIKAKNKSNTSEKDIFITTIDLLDQCCKRSDQLTSEWGFNVNDYDESFYSIIENLLYVKYSEGKTDVILWWVYNRFDSEGKLMPIKFNDHIGKTEEEVFVETPADLWKFLKRMDKLDKK